MTAVVDAPRVRLALFGRPPVPGRVKTRLATALGSEGAARLYAAFVQDLLARARASSLPFTLWVDGAIDDPTLAAFDAPLVPPAGSSFQVAVEDRRGGRFPRRRWTGQSLFEEVGERDPRRGPRIPGTNFRPGELAPQVGEDLGARMSHAFHVELERAERVVLIGTDVPTLPERLFDAASRALDEHEVVFSPSEDGGYVLVAARVVPRFEGVRWSGPHALADSLRACPGATCIEPWYDVDTPDDLERLRAELAVDPGAAPRTAAVLRTLTR